ncbi:unnamed protein product [Cochlearia groenlandica]
MAKVFFLCLVLTTLLTLFHCTKSEEIDVIVKDGHRVVVVEYDGKTTTRVLISPPGKESSHEGEVFKNVKKKAIETASSLPVIGQAEKETRAHATETISEAASRAARGLEETKAHEAQYSEDKVLNKAHEAKNKVINKAQKAQNVWEKTRITVRGIGTVVAAALRLTKIGSVVSVIVIAAAYGMCVWVTVVSSHLLGSVLGRQQYGVVQSKLYPVYFKAISVGILVGLLGHVISRRRKVFTDAVEMWQAVNLLCSVLMVEVNASFVEPRATKAIFDRIKVEKEEGRGLDTAESQLARTSGDNKVIKKMNNKDPVVEQRLTKLNERLSRLNVYSSRLNLLTLVSLTWHFVYLGHRLSLTC